MFFSWIYLPVLRRIFKYFLDLRICFSNQENISQYVLRHLWCRISKQNVVNFGSVIEHIF